MDQHPIMVFGDSCLKIQETEVLGATKEETLLYHDKKKKKSTNDRGVKENGDISSTWKLDDIIDVDDENIEKARLYIFDETEFRYKDDDLVTNTDIQRVTVNASIHEPLPPLL